jgi:hypothetical protein
MKHKQKCFDSSLGVFCCGHVFRNERPVKLVIYEGGDWQFMCGGNDHKEANDGFYIHVGHLISQDPSLNEISDLSADSEAERHEPGALWIRSAIHSSPI